MTVAAVASTVVVAAGCGRSVSKSDFRNTLMTESKLSAQVADCVTEELFRKLDDNQLKRVYTLSRTDLTQVERETVQDAAILCFSGGPKPETTGTAATQ